MQEAVVQSLLCLNLKSGFFLLVSTKILDTDAWLLKLLSVLWGQTKGLPNPLDPRKHECPHLHTPTKMNR